MNEGRLRQQIAELQKMVSFLAGKLDNAYKLLREHKEVLLVLSEEEKIVGPQIEISGDEISVGFSEMEAESKQEAQALEQKLSDRDQRIKERQAKAEAEARSKGQIGPIKAGQRPVPGAPTNAPLKAGQRLRKPEQTQEVHAQDAALMEINRQEEELRKRRELLLRK